MSTKTEQFDTLVKNIRGFVPEMPREYSFSAEVISALPPRNTGKVRAILFTVSVTVLRVAAVLLIGLLVIQQYNDLSIQKLPNDSQFSKGYSEGITHESTLFELDDSLSFDELSATELISLSVRYSRFKIESQPKIRQMATDNQIL